MRLPQTALLACVLATSCGANGDQGTGAPRTANRPIIRQLILRVEPSTRGPVRAITRAASVSVDAAAISPTTKQLQIRLFEKTATLILDEANQTEWGLMWRGHILDDHPGSAAIFSSSAETVGGTVLLSDGTQYELVQIDGATYELREIDNSAAPPELPPGEVKLIRKPGADVRETCTSDSVENIDVLVLYTEAAERGARAKLNNTVLQAVTQANASLADAGIGSRIRLVGLQKIDYAETGELEVDRDRLRATSDGHLDAVAQLRDDRGADVVVLVVENGGGYCGVSYVMSEPSNQFESYAYAVAVRSCAAAPSFSFTHELGHIFGTRHDWYSDPTVDASYPNNHAHINPKPRAATKPWRTVMSYNGGCLAKGTNCVRLLKWSSPRRNHPPRGAGMEPLGVDTGTHQCDNAKVLAQTLATVSNFRCTRKR